MKLKLHLTKVNRFHSFLMDRLATWQPDRDKLFQLAFDFIHYGSDRRLKDYIKELSGAKSSNDILKILEGEQYGVVQTTSADYTTEEKSGGDK